MPVAILAHGRAGVCYLARLPMRESLQVGHSHHSYSAVNSRVSSTGNVARQRLHWRVRGAGASAWAPTSSWLDAMGGLRSATLGGRRVGSDYGPAHQSRRVTHGSRSDTAQWSSRVVFGPLLGPSQPEGTDPPMSIASTERAAIRRGVLRAERRSPRFGPMGMTQQTARAAVVFHHGCKRTSDDRGEEARAYPQREACGERRQTGRAEAGSQGLGFQVASRCWPKSRYLAERQPKSP